jgi:SSS family solute:Na+ symporter
VTVTRVVIGLLALTSVGMQALTPVTLSALGALALPLSVQLWTPLLGICWLRRIGRGAAMAGVGFGIAGVLLTEPAGHAALSFLGLDLPWGRWPWTLHSALWGFVPNLCVALLVAAFSRHHTPNDEAQDVRRLLDVTLSGKPQVRALKTTAWSAVLAWLFLAVGPGLIFANTAFLGTDGVWLVGMPSLWGWAAMFWAAGLGLVWFLSFKMEMASPLNMQIPPYTPPPRLRRDQTLAEQARLRAALITLAVASAVLVLTVLSFGG